jgi:hypothetical protein
VLSERFFFFQENLNVDVGILLEYPSCLMNVLTEAVKLKAPDVLLSVGATSQITAYQIETPKVSSEIGKLLKQLYIRTFTH